MGYPIKHIVGFDGQTYDIPTGGGLRVVEYSTNSGGSLMSGGTAYAPSKSELILLTSNVDFNSSSPHAEFSGGFTLDTNHSNWNHYNLANATWKTMLCKYCYILARAVVYNGTLTIEILDTYKLVYTLTSPTAAQIKYYTGGLKYKAASVNEYTELSSNLDHIDVYDDKVVIALTLPAHVQNIQMIMDVCLKIWTMRCLIKSMAGIKSLIWLLSLNVVAKSQTTSSRISNQR